MIKEIVLQFLIFKSTSLWVVLLSLSPSPYSHVPKDPNQISGDKSPITTF